MKTNVEIKKEVINKLKSNTVLRLCDIDVDVICGTVYLSGKVDSYHKRFEAGNIVRKIEDVKRVQLDIYVELPRENKRSDEQIRDEIKNILHTSLQEDDISVRVYDGIVVLTGTVDRKQQKAAATDAILDVQGILNIWNFVKIKTNAIYSEEKNRYIPDNQWTNKGKIQLNEPVAV